MRIDRAHRFIILFCWFNAIPVLAQGPAPAVARPGHSLHGEAFDEGPRRRAEILEGMGDVKFPVTTSSGEAQAFVSQGVAQLHSFYYYEAERSFRTAAMIDPKCAMAYWGMAMANVNNAKRARGFLSRARDLAGDPALTRRERLYIESLNSLYKEGGDGGNAALVRGLEAVVQDSPTDADARAWLALSLYQSGHLDSPQAVDIVLESVFRIVPDHPGAHHYRIHLWDARQATLALESAANYARSAPGIAHAWHMPGHTYTELHRYADAARHQETSARVDHSAMRRDRTMPFEIHNYSHNNQWLCTSLSHIGRAREAIAVARNLVEQPRDPDRNSAGDAGSAQRLGRLRWAEVMIRHELWDQLIEVTSSGDLDWSDLPAERIMKAYGLGLAYAAKGDQGALAGQVATLTRLAAEEAKRAAESKGRKVSLEIDLGSDTVLDQAELTRQVSSSLKAAGDRAKQERSSSPITAESASPRSALFGSAGELTLEAALAELEGYQLLARGDIGAAFVKFAKTLAMRPEARARAHLRVGNAAFAATSAKAALEKAPDEFATLACYLEVMSSLGRAKEAADAMRRLDSYPGHDEDLPVLDRLERTGGRPRRPDGGSNGPGGNPGTIAGESLGPLAWEPFDADPFSLTDDGGKEWSLSGNRGRTTLLLFFLGGKCAHCLQQLQEFGSQFDALKALGVDIVAVGTDPIEDVRSLKANEDGIRFPMPILADPKLKVFRAYHAFDEFEQDPLHGVFLIDARGKVRWRRISAEPFLDINFIKSEAGRIVRPSPRGRGD